MPHLVLIDGPNYVYRAFHAIRHLTNAKGQPTNAVYGYVQMLQAVLRDLAPTHAAVCFDPEGGSFRNHEFEAYKSHRPPMPEDLQGQWPYIRKITRAYHLPLVCVDDFEADDAIATLASKAETAGWDVTIVSSDKDLLQLVSERVHMLDTMKGQRYDTKAVHDKWGVGPGRIRDLLALAGDSSDNIPGVPGIGPKTAADLIAAYGGLEAVLAHAGDIKQAKRRENLLRHADDARLSYALVGLRQDVPIALSLDELRMREPDKARLSELFRELEFRHLLAGLAPDAPAGEAHAAGMQARLVASEEDFASLLAQLAAAEMIAVDLETSSLTCHDADIVGLAFAVEEGTGWYIPVGHTGEGSEQQLPVEQVLPRLKPMLQDADKPKCGHNLKYDMQVLRRAGIELAGVRFDSMLLAYCLHPGRYIPKLDAVALDHLGYHCTSYEDVAGKGAKQIPFAAVPVAKATAYAAEDAAVALRLSHRLSAGLAAEGRLKRHDDIELPLMPVLADMEWVGVKIDAGLLAGLSQEFGRRIAAIEADIHAAAGETFNIHSPKQLGTLLFETLKLPGGKRTKTGAWATGQEVLESLADLHDVPRLVLASRQLAKLKSTYTDALQRLIHAGTGRVHTSYNQAVTSTGRLSSSDPNLQNIPIRTEEGRRIRQAFIAEDGHLLISADYSQIELRLMAHFSGDKGLIAAFERKLDIHAATAAAVNQVSLDQVTSEQRRRAKIINFGIFYGMSAFGLSKQLGVAREDAQAFINAYFAQYPKVSDFMQATLEQARARGFVETLLGHRVDVPEINAGNGMRRQYAERTAINAPLQGSAADLIKVAMIRLHRRLKNEVPAAHLILQVHDELVVEAPQDQANKVAAIMKETMESAARLAVPLTADIGIGPNWFAAHAL